MKLRVFNIVLLSVCLMVSAISCGSQEVESKNTAAVRMMQILPANCVGFYYMNISELRTSDYGASILEYLNSEANMYFPEQISSTGMVINDTGDEYILLYEGNFGGDFSPPQMIGESTGSYNYGGFTVWTIDEYGQSVVLIDNVSVFSDDITIKRCIDVANDIEDSIYDSAKDVVDRLPDGFELYVFTVNDEDALEGFEGLLAEGMSVTKHGDTNVGTTVRKFDSVESAQRFTEYGGVVSGQNSLFMTNQDTSSDVNIEGVFVTVVIASAVPALDSGAYNSLCFQSFGEGNMSQVIYYCSKSIELNPYYPLVYSYRGAAYEVLGDYDKALSDYNQYIALYPDDYFGYYKRGRLQQSFGHESEAIDDFQKCLTLNPDEYIRELVEAYLEELD